MTSPQEIEAMALKEQVESTRNSMIVKHKQAYERLAQTGQPLDDQDRQLIRFLICSALGDFCLDSSKGA